MLAGFGHQRKLKKNGLMRNLLTPLVRSVMIPSGLTVADAGIHKKLGSGTSDSETTAQKISNKEMEGIMKIV